MIFMRLFALVGSNCGVCKMLMFLSVRVHFENFKYFRGAFDALLCCYVLRVHITLITISTHASKYISFKILPFGHNGFIESF